MESNLDGWYVVVSFALMLCMGSWFTEFVGLMMATYVYLTVSFRCNSNEGMERERV